MRGWVFNLLVQLLLSSHSPVGVLQNSQPYFTVSFEAPPTSRGQVSIFISIRNRVAQSYPWALGFLLLPLTTRRVMVEVFLPASTRVFFTSLQVQAILQPTVNRPVHLGVGPPLEQMTRFYISLNDNYFLSSSCGMPSLMRGRVCNLQCNFASSS
jgi:hypothetical protein